jgi:hypothetical protein
MFTSVPGGTAPRTIGSGMYFSTISRRPPRASGQVVGHSQAGGDSDHLRRPVAPDQGGEGPSLRGAVCFGLARHTGHSLRRILAGDPDRPGSPWHRPCSCSG